MTKFANLKYANYEMSDLFDDENLNTSAFSANEMSVIGFLVFFLLVQIEQTSNFMASVDVIWREIELKKNREPE